jgi:hypothetical protein
MKKSKKASARVTAPNQEARVKARALPSPTPPCPRSQDPAERLAETQDLAGRRLPANCLTLTETRSPRDGRAFTFNSRGLALAGKSARRTRARGAWGRAIQIH